MHRHYRFASHKNMDTDDLFNSFHPKRHYDDTKRKGCQFVKWNILTYLTWLVNSLYNWTLSLATICSWLTFTTGNPFKEEILCWCYGLKGGAVATGDEKERFWQVLLGLLRAFWCVMTMSNWCHLQGTLAALVLWQAGEGREYCWSCCTRTGGGEWLASNVN